MWTEVLKSRKPPSLNTEKRIFLGGEKGKKKTGWQDFELHKNVNFYVSHITVTVYVSG